MKYGIFAAVLTALLSLQGRAEEDSYLYWMFDNYDTGYAFDSARIGVVTDGSTEYLSIGLGEGYTAGNGSVSFLEMYTKVSVGAGEGSAFLLELLNGESVSYVSDLVNWGAASVVSSAGMSSGSPTAFTVSSVPEPTSGLLLLLGVAALALRRRNLRGIVAALAVICCFGARAAYDDTMICFSTKGPDRYADGTTVKDGERYALVWSADGDFDGFKADGTLVDPDDEVLVIVPFAKDGRCTLAAYAMPSEKFARGGVIALWLLDTRVYAENGAASFAAAEGPAKVAAVSAAAKVTSDIAVQPGADRGFAALEGAKPSPTALPAGTPKPVIRGFRIDEGAKLVYLTVDNTVPYVNYGVTSGGKPSGLRPSSSAKPVTGGGTITVVTEKTDDAMRFFGVGRQ